MTKTQIVWATFRPELLRGISRRVRNPEDARDLLQEVFIKIHLKLPALTQTERLGAWVHRIPRNTVLDYLKRPALRPRGRSRSIGSVVGSGIYSKPEPRAGAIAPISGGLVNRSEHDGFTF